MAKSANDSLQLSRPTDNYHCPLLPSALHLTADQFAQPSYSGHRRSGRSHLYLPLTVVKAVKHYDSSSRPDKHLF